MPEWAESVGWVSATLLAIGIIWRTALRPLKDIALWTAEHGPTIRSIAEQFPANGTSLTKKIENIQRGIIELGLEAGRAKVEAEGAKYTAEKARRVAAEALEKITEMSGLLKANAHRLDAIEARSHAMRSTDTKEVTEGITSLLTEAQKAAQAISAMQAHDEAVASDLRESHERADEVISGEPGEAADAASQSGKGKEEDE